MPPTLPRRVTILTGIFPPDIGGPATSVPALVQALADDGWNVTVVTAAESAGRDSSDPCPVVRVSRAQPWSLRAGAIVRGVLASRPDVVLANGLHLESTLVPRIPVVQKIVGDWAWERARNGGLTAVGIEEFQRGPLAPKPRAIRAIRRLVTRRARMVIVPSQYLARVCAGWRVPESRIRVVPNAAPAIDSAPGVKAGSRRAARALFVGRLVSWKHVDDVIRVLPRIAVLTLDVVGTGDQQPALQELARELNVEQRVRFLGAEGREDIFARMRDSTMLVLPSSYEGMPHVVLEAFASRLPVVASAAGGTPELVRDGTGFLHPCRDLDALEAAIRSALDPEQAAIAVDGGAQVARQLTLQATAAATERVLADALGSDRPDEQ
jgi:glycosyltransferase involved in cell wall biosynthesis